ncbi:hypothetical protein Tco_0893748 [Tanacetum coccineum]|uniref:Uncharacterized protein n=1 Tax=Tanacetum coccineum TaxID=301880 RepID=A0ABQ5C9Q8_9ASTR
MLAPSGGGLILYQAYGNLYAMIAIENWGSDEQPSDVGSPGVIVYRYDGLHIHPYPEYLVPSDAEAPIKDQPLSDDASLTALSSGYVADSDPEEDLEEDHADGGDADDESSDDDDDDDANDEDEEASEDEDDDEEEEEH